MNWTKEIHRECKMFLDKYAKILGFRFTERVYANKHAAGGCIK